MWRGGGRSRPAQGGKREVQKKRGHGGEQNGVEAEGPQARRPAGRLARWEGVWAEHDRGAAPDVLPLEATVTAAPEGPLKKGSPTTPPRVWRRTTTTPPPPTPRPGRHSDDASWRDGRDSSTTAKPPRDAPQRRQPRARVVRYGGPVGSRCIRWPNDLAEEEQGERAQVGGTGTPSLRARRPRRVSRPEGQRGGPPAARSDTNRGGASSTSVGRRWPERSLCRA